MDSTSSLLSKFATGLILAGLSAYSLDAAAFGSRGTRFDNQCASLSAAPAAPQQSRPYQASGSDCALCHVPPGTSLNLTAAGQASSTANPVTAMNPYCINTRPTTASITAPAANGTSVAPGGTVTFTGNSADPDGFTLTYTWALSNGASLTGKSVTYTVPTSATGTITATLTVKDPDGATSSNTATRSITIAAAPPPSAPVATADSHSVQTGTTLTVAAPGVLSNDTGTAPLTAALNSNVAHGTLSLSANGGFTYTPATGYTGTDSFTYKASNSAGSSVATTVTITVNAAPPAGNPVANADSYSVQTGKALTVATPGVLSNDTGTGTLTAQIATSPANAKVFSLKTDGGFSYTPKTGFTGTDSFTYKAKAGTKLSTAATVTIRVTAAGPCLDKDQDGYSPEGKSCGPIDCNDNNAAITTCVTTKACIDTLIAKAVRIDSAVWHGDEIKVTGSKAAKKATVKIYNAVSNMLLGTVRAQDSGAWSFEREHLSAVPCRVRVEINNNSGQRKVSGAPVSCVSSGEPSCGSSGRGSHEEDDEHESDNEHGDDD